MILKLAFQNRVQQPPYSRCITLFNSIQSDQMIEFYIHSKLGSATLNLQHNLRLRNPSHLIKIQKNELIEFKVIKW